MAKRVTQTSKEAYKRALKSGVMHTQCAMFLKMLRGKKRHGLTIAEINARTGVQKSSISARIRKLIDAGILKELPKRKQTTGGCMARPVAIR